MCGIVGIFIKNKKLEAKLGIYLSKMINNMSSRGPDSAGFAIYDSLKNKKFYKFSLCLSDNINVSHFIKDIKKKFKDIKTKKLANHLVVTTSSKIENFKKFINEHYKDKVSRIPVSFMIFLKYLI